MVPFMSLTLVFSHRVPTYIFFVYPFFLIIAAYGIVNILNCEMSFLKKDSSFKKPFLRVVLIGIFFVLFIISPWLRISLKIPFFGDGKTNMAVTFDEWREGIQKVLPQIREGDIMLTSLPQVALYYGINSDYGLNWANLNQAIDEDFKNEQKQWIDIYTGTPCVETLDMLKDIISANPRGWIIVTQYHFTHENVIPAEIREYIMGHFGEPESTKKGSVLLFHWS
jgi:hypothetical protein